MKSDTLATRIVDDIEPGLLDFVETAANSFIKWDLVQFFHDHPRMAYTPETIARSIGRDLHSVDAELHQLTAASVLQSIATGHATCYTLAADTDLRYVMHKFILSCNDRRFRVKAIYHVMRSAK